MYFQLENLIFMRELAPLHHEGYITEMATGEGKTLTSTLPVGSTG